MKSMSLSKRLAKVSTAHRKRSTTVIPLRGSCDLWLDLEAVLPCHLAHHYHKYARRKTLGKRQSQTSVAIRNSGSGMAPYKTNLRAQRTRVFIQNAFTELAAKRGFNSVSVQDIAKQAMINRATFYRYYKDKYYLAEAIFKSALHKVDVAIGPRVFRHEHDLIYALADEGAQAAWAGLFDHFSSNSGIYGPLLSGKGSAWFLERMREELMKSFKRIHRTRQSVVPIEVARCFFASATIGITYFWLKGGMRHSAAQMAAWFRLMMYKGYMGVIAGIN
jgi:AcrR family transcriptional regulator